MSQLPTAYVAKLFDRPPRHPRDGMTAATLEDLVDRLARADVHSPAVPSLMRAKPPAEMSSPSALFVLGDGRLKSIADWAGSVSVGSYASVVGYACSELDKDGYLDASDMPLLTGHGIVLASRGLTGRPLVGLGLEELRRELEQSHLRLSEFAGYRVRILMPTPTTFGNAVDGLVLEEAHRAGYKLVLRPGRTVTDLADDDERTHGAIHTVQYRIVRTDDSAEHLHKWIVGKGLSRQVAQVRDLVNGPRRILSRFGLE